MYPLRSERHQAERSGQTSCIRREFSARKTSLFVFLFFFSARGSNNISSRHAEERSEQTMCIMHLASIGAQEMETRKGQSSFSPISSLILPPPPLLSSLLTERQGASCLVNRSSGHEGEDELVKPMRAAELTLVRCVSYPLSLSLFSLFCSFLSSCSVVLSLFLLVYQVMMTILVQRRFWFPSLRNQSLILRLIPFVLSFTLCLFLFSLSVDLSLFFLSGDDDESGSDAIRLPDLKLLPEKEIDQLLAQRMYVA